MVKLLKLCKCMVFYSTHGSTLTYLKGVSLFWPTRGIRVICVHFV